MVVLLVTMVSGAINRMKFGKGLAYLIGGIYGFFIFGSTYIAFK